MSTSYNFKDNLTVDNNKYMKWLDKTGTSRSNIITLDDDNNVNLNSAFGNMKINADKPDSYTFINSNNSKGNVLVGTKLGIGFNSTENMISTVTLVKNGSIGLNTSLGTSDGYLGLSGSFDLSNISGSRLLLYGNNHVTNPGNIHLYTGNVTNGNINIYTGNDSLRMQILQNGTFSIIPDGINTRLTINDIHSTFNNDIIITSTTESHNASTGALQIQGGIGIIGNLYVDGTISLNSATGNINFDSSQISSSYTSGAIFLSGGIGISTTINASSITSGGALSIAGGVAVGKDVYIGGKLTITNTTPSTSSQTGSFVIYGGMGINDAILSRADASQIQISPKTTGHTTEILFYSLNNFSSTSNTGSSWRIGQNVGGIGPGKFALNNDNYGNVLTASYDGSIGLSGRVVISNTENAINEDNGGSLTVYGGASFKKNIYIGGVLTLVSGGSISGAGGSSEYNNLNITSTDASINLSTGSVIINGGITIKGDVEAESVTKGGSILTAGGVSIGKSLFVGGPIMKIPVGTTLVRPNPAQTGYIRYNSTTSQFEGYGPGNAWGSLGGVIDIAQTTKILASENPSVTDGNLYFYTVGQEHMRINSVGNIGIGTSSPNIRMDVNGNLGIKSESSPWDHIYLTHDGSRAIFRAGGANDGLSFDVNASTFGSYGSNDYIRIMSLFSSGNVGIGTTNPSGTLDVISSNTFGQLYLGQHVQNRKLVLCNNAINEHEFYGLGINSNTLRYQIPDSSTGYRFYVGTSATSSNELMCIQGNGYVGIGTNAPVYKLHVNGNACISSYFSASSDSNTVGNIFTTGGNVGIGIAAPSYHLDVNGNMHVNANLYVDGLISGGTDTGSTFAYLTLTATDDSINLSTGSLLTYGGITIQSPTDAESVTNGGSFLTSGGVAIGKRLFVGDDIIANKSLNILSSENSLGIGTGGSLTVLGGASFSKDVYVGGTVTSSSDIRLKKNITEFNGTLSILDKIDNIRTIKYNYIHDESNTPYVGFIAQDFIEDFPELLRCPKNGYYSLDYQKISVILIECIKELKTEIRSLKEKQKNSIFKRKNSIFKKIKDKFYY